MSFSFFLCLSTYFLLKPRTNLNVNKPPKEDRIDQAIAHEFQITKDPKLGYVPRERLLVANRRTKELKQNTRRQMARNVEWVERGPNSVGGRTRALIFDKADPFGNTILAGSVAGGIWRGEFVFGAKPIWKNLTPQLDNLAIGCLFQDPDDPQIIYAGTGEGWFNADAVRGAGILKSVDGGQSWEIMPSTANAAFYHVQKNHSR